MLEVFHIKLSMPMFGGKNYKVPPYKNVKFIHSMVNFVGFTENVFRINVETDLIKCWKCWI